MFLDQDPVRLIALVPASILGTDYSTISVGMELRANDPSVLSADVIVRLYSTFGDLGIGGSPNMAGIQVTNLFRQIRLKGTVQKLIPIVANLTYNPGQFCGSDDIIVEITDGQGNPIHSAGIEVRQSVHFLVKINSVYDPRKIIN